MRVLIIGASRGIGLQFVRQYLAAGAEVSATARDETALAGRAVCVALHPGWVRTDMGGERADLDVTDSVTGMRRLLGALTGDDNGRFLNDDGTAIDW